MEKMLIALSSSKPQSQIRRPKAILFDNDGVLVASEPFHWDAWQMLLKELDIEYREEEVRSLIGKTGPQIISAILDRHVPDWTADQYDVHQLARRKNDHYLKIALQGLTAYPGVKEGLQELKKIGIRTAVVSNAKTRELESALSITGLKSLVDVTVSRDDIPNPKPDPIAYITAAALLNVPPGNCLAVEDSPPGLESALMGKIPAAAITTNFPEAVLKAPVLGRPDLKPIWMGSDIRQLFEWVLSLT